MCFSSIHKIEAERSGTEGHSRITQGIPSLPGIPASKLNGQMWWWHLPVILVLGWQRQDDGFETLSQDKTKIARYALAWLYSRR